MKNASPDLRQRRVHAGRAWLFAAVSGLLLWLAPHARAQAPAWTSIEVWVHDVTGQPVPGAITRLQTELETYELITDPQGRAVFRIPVPAKPLLHVEKQGFQTIEKQMELLVPEPVTIEVTLPAAEQLQQSVTVTGEAITVAPGTGAQTTTSSTELKALPSRPGSLRDALPLIPGITRTPEGKLRISDSPEHRSAFLINSLDVTDPATGAFGATIPIDAVATVDVYRSPFLAEFGRFTAGVVAVETEMGSNRWRWELNDPTPELRVRSKRLRGIRAFTPRVSTSGPLVPNRLYFTEAFEYRLNKTPIFSLAFPENEDRKESWNSLTQLDYIASDHHWVRLTAHLVPQKHAFANLNFHDPRPVTPTYSGGEYRLALSDRQSGPFGLVESALSAAQVSAKVWGQGDQPLTLRPVQNTGNYFMNLGRWAERYQWVENWTPPVLTARGQHLLKVGASVMHVRTRGYYRARPVSVRGPHDELLQEILFTNRDPYRLSEFEAAFFAQDQWNLTPTLTLNLGLRADGQTAADVWRLGPRLALAWSPWPEARTVFRAGYGWFYDRVPLSIFSFDHYPQRTVLRYDQNPVQSLVFENRLAPGQAFRSPLIFGSARPGAYAPRSRTWQLQTETRFREGAQLRLTYIESDSFGLIVLRPEPEQTPPRLTLADLGQARHRQFEVLSKFRVYKGGQVIASYIHSTTRGNLNDFTEFLGNFPLPLVRPDLVSDWPGTIPHRFLSWAVIPLTDTIHVAPVIEYRSGFPYAVLNAAQDYVGRPYSQRFPNFFSFDFRVSKDFQWRNYRFRLSFSSFNLTNHFNPDTVRWNTADSLFGEFLGNHDRRFRIDLDVLF